MIFLRRIEDFTCEHCGAPVKGDGYTNHCPKCLWSKHVDTNPGDRASDCGGMMRPLRLEKEGDEYILTHRCEKCGHEKRNKMAPADDFEQALRAVGLA
jgi:rubrerythrin